ncbi:MAG: DUF4180 domain-containing protein [Anaerolineaceae bacterium]|nr:DUF4180 domain-containing protein [Anaerolineaceae bacterium]
MDVQVIQHHGITIVESLPGSGQIANENDVLDLVAACGEHGSDRLLLHEGNLSADFYDLRSGLAGVVMLKLSNYRLRAAAVLPPEKSGQGRFGEMVLETNRGRQFRVYPEREAALDWLASA